MPSTAVLEPSVTLATTRATTAQECPVPTVEGAFRAVRLTVMNGKTRRQLKHKAELQMYHDTMLVKPRNYNDILRMGWIWHVGKYDPATGHFKALDYLGMTEVDTPADPLFVSMTAALDRELSKVPGIQYRFTVESLWIDPIGAVEIWTGGVKRIYRYYAWYGNRTTWPPSRG